MFDGKKIDKLYEAGKAELPKHSKNLPSGFFEPSFPKIINSLRKANKVLRKC